MSVAPETLLLSILLIDRAVFSFLFCFSLLFYYSDYRLLFTDAFGKLLI